MLSALGISSSAVPAGLCILGTQKKSKFVLEIPSHPCYNIHMNKQEQLAIDRATDDAEWYERKALISEAELDPHFATYFLGWMTMSDELEAAAKTFLEWKKS